MAIWLLTPLLATDDNVSTSTYRPNIEKSTPPIPVRRVVEVSAVVGGYGIHPVHVGPLPEPIAANLRQHVDVFELVVEVALTGDRRVALDALLLLALQLFHLVATSWADRLE